MRLVDIQDKLTNVVAWRRISWQRDSHFLSADSLANQSSMAASKISTRREIFSFPRSFPRTRQTSVQKPRSGHVRVDIGEVAWLYVQDTHNLSCQDTFWFPTILDDFSVHPSIHSLPSFLPLRMPPRAAAKEEEKREDGKTLFTDCGFVGGFSRSSDHTRRTERFFARDSGDWSPPARGGMPRLRECPKKPFSHRPQSMLQILLCIPRVSPGISLAYTVRSRYCLWQGWWFWLTLTTNLSLYES